MTATAASLRGRPGGFSTGTGKQTVAGRAQRIWEYRRILRLLVGRDLKVRYAGSALGYVWSVLDPLLMSLVYWMVFVGILHRHVGYEPYIVFLLSGQLAWFWINGTITSSIRALRGEAQMVRSSNVPREIWVLRVVFSKGAEYVFSLPILVAFALGYRVAPTPYILLFPVGMLMSAVLGTGLALIIAPLTVLVRDTERVITPVLRVLFYLSPIIYSVEVLDTRIPKSIQPFQALNPLLGIMEVFRSTFFPAELHWRDAMVSGLVSLVILAIGVYVFGRLERPVLKEI